MAAAARRFGIIVGSIVGGTAVLALLLGLAFGSSVSRSLSVGWYSVGSVLLISGFFVGNRGPARPEGEGWSLFSVAPLGALGDAGRAAGNAVAVGRARRARVPADRARRARGHPVQALLIVLISVLL
jgi:hypothetical protein